MKYLLLSVSCLLLSSCATTGTGEPQAGVVVSVTWKGVSVSATWGALFGEKEAEKSEPLTVGK